MHYLPRALMRGNSLISSISRDTLSTNETNEKENFDDWYIIMLLAFLCNGLLFSLFSLRY